MIEFLGLTIPSNELPRDKFDKKELEKFERVTGILHTRHFTDSTSEVVRKTIDLYKENIPDDIEAVILVTQSPDRLSPCLAVSVHNQLSLMAMAPAFDVNQSCAGYVFGLHLCQQLAKKCLLVCVDKIRYAKTPLESLMFSDSCSVSVVNSRPNEMKFAFHIDGSGADKIYCNMDGKMDMQGDRVFEFVTEQIPGFIKRFNLLNWAEYLICHQANLSMLKLIEARSGFYGKMFCSIKEFGNLSMNSIPATISLNEDRILGRDIHLCGFGAGYSSALTRLRWSPKAISEMTSI